MDIKVINLQKNKLTKVSKFSQEERGKYLSDFLYMALGLKIVKKDFNLCDDIKGNIDYLCIDEAYRLVIVEKRESKFSRTIKNGLLYIDYIKENISKVKMILNDTLGTDISKNVCFDTRLVILTESFNSFDYSSIKHLPYTIEAINYTFLDNNLIFVKEYQNKVTNYINYKGNMNNSLYLDLEEFLLSLGDDVCIWGYNNLITVRKIKVIAFIMITDVITIILDNKQYVISNDKDLEKMKVKIEKVYDEN